MAHMPCQLTDHIFFEHSIGELHLFVQLHSFVLLLFSTVWGMHMLRSVQFAYLLPGR